MVREQNDMTTDALIDEFDRVQQRWGLCESTRKIRRWLLTTLTRTVDPHTATTADIEAFLDAQRIGASTRRTYLAQIASFFQWMETAGLRTDNPTKQIRSPKVGRMLPRPVATADLAAALETAAPLLRAWLTLAAFQGLRCCEIASLTRQAILDGRATPVLVVEHGKGGKQRIVPLHPATWAALIAYGLPDYGPVFTLRPGRQVPAATVSRYVGAYFGSLGMPWTAHNLRHWFGCEVYAASLDLRTTQELLGHANPNTTAGYTAWSPGRGVDVVLGLTA